MMPFPHTLRLLVVVLPLLSAVLPRGSAALSFTTSASNITLNGGNGTFALSNPLHFASPVSLSPLTGDLAALDSRDYRAFHCEGSLVLTTSSNTASITSKDIALLSCDPSAYPGYLNASTALSSLIASPDGGPSAVVLYSTQSDHCSLQELDRTARYANIFTILQASAAEKVVNDLHADPAHPLGNITANMATTGGVGSNSTADVTDSGNNGGLSNSAPTTAVAMIILYTITGIITALFLGIIITGAVRAHRHPERYGPRNVVGRPRQSRARGLARAMLETIPIVKFGDSDSSQVAAAKRDIEMASRHEEEGTSEPVVSTAATPHDPHAAASQQADAVDPSGEGPTSMAGHDDHEPPAATGADAGNPVCPICTDEFVKGQDMRVLPCNHQFHPECIDPWLINVSGTCPLCRIDLNPADEPSGDAEQTGQNSTEQTPAEGAAAGPTDDSNNRPGPATTPAPSTSHRRLTGYLSDIRRARNASVEERLAALRQLRQNEQQDADNTNNDSHPAGDAADHRRRRLTMRLRERFRIRTRQHR